MVALEGRGQVKGIAIVRQGARVSQLGEGGLPLSIIPDVAYPDLELELRTGDVVVFYTDGISEAANEAEEMYGIQRLEQVVERIDPTTNAEAIIQTILQDVAGFVGSAEQFDDMTVVVVKKL